MPQPKEILITHVYSSDNKGDAALTSVLLSDLKRVFPAAKQRILKLDHVHESGKFESVPEYASFMHFALNKYKNPFVKLAYVMFMLPATLVWALVFRAFGKRLWLPRELRMVADMYAAADLIVAVGGGYIRSRKGLFNRLNIPLLLHPLLFGSILGKPTVLYSQSVGPFVNSYEPAMVSFVLRKMALVILREDVSAGLLNKIGVRENVVRSVDSGFLLRAKRPVNVRKRYGIAKDTLLIGVTVREWLHGEEQEAYERAVASVLDAVVERYGARVLFIPQVTAAKGDDDRIASRRVREFMYEQQNAVVIEDAPDHFDVKAIYNELDVLLGTRFHSVIFSLTSHVPVLAIEYEHKTSGIMHDLNLDHWVIKIEEATSEALTKGLAELIAQRGAYQKQLEHTMPQYVSVAEQTAELVAQQYAAYAVTE
jgi:colanic acid/amylovoran biosynthesis protein